jgi:hypothetical protein
MIDTVIRLEITNAQARVVLRGLAVYRELLEKTSKGEEKAGVPNEATLERIELVDEIARQLRVDETGDLFAQMPEAWRVRGEEADEDVDPETGEERA